MSNTPVISYDVPGAARAMGVGKSTVWRMIAAGQVETFKLGSRTLIRADVLQALVDRLSRPDAA